MVGPWGNQNSELKGAGKSPNERKILMVENDDHQSEPERAGAATSLKPAAMQTMLVDDNTPIQPSLEEGELMSFDRIWARSAFEVKKAIDSCRISDIIIGSGESASVRSRMFAESVHPEIVDGLAKGSKMFKFGNGEAFDSLGIILSTGWIESGENGVKTKKPPLKMDVVAAEVPMLLSRVAMKKMVPSLSFVHHELILPGG